MNKNRHIKGIWSLLVTPERGFFSSGAVPAPSVTSVTRDSRHPAHGGGTPPLLSEGGHR